MSMKVMTDTEITINLLLETILLPLVNLCVDKQLSSQKGVELCVSSIQKLMEKKPESISCNQSILTTLDIVVK